MKGYAMSRAGACCVAAVTALCSCGEQAPEVPEIVQAPVAAPVRFASAAALLDDFNARMTSGDHAGIVALLYAENELQSRLVSVARASLPTVEYIAALRARFPAKAGSIGSWEEVFIPSPTGPARITREDGPRAVASYPARVGSTRTLDLVQVGERWWISASTLENDRDVKLFIGVLDVIRRTFDESASFSRACTLRLRAGEFSSFEEATQAMRAEYERFYAAHPDSAAGDKRLGDAVFSYMTSRPK